MDTVAVACGNTFPGVMGEMVTNRDGIEYVPIADVTDRTVVDAVLAGLADRRLLVLGTDSDLAGIVSRLIRTGRLTEVVLGYVTTDPESRFRRLWHLPQDPATAVETAVHADPTPVPVLRDDVGGVLVGLGRVRGVTGVVYCDNDRVLSGSARVVDVVPDRAAGLRVRVGGRGPLRRDLTRTGRAVQFGLSPTAVVRDGLTHPRPLDKWSWYRNVDDLILAGA